MSPFPWQGSQWRRMAAALEQKRLPHALVLAGCAGLGKLEFARTLAQAALCLTPTAALAACAQCKACRLFAAGNHPDLLLAQPEKDGGTIRIDAIRFLTAALALTPHYGARRVALVAPAEALNRNAADALLKTLEEPPGETLMLLVCENPSSLPATIRSRCQVVAFQPPPEDEGITWLKEQVPGADNPAGLLRLAGGAPLRAAQLHAEGYPSLRNELLSALGDMSAGRAHPVTVAERWVTHGAANVVDTLQQLLRDLARTAMGVDAIRHGDQVHYLRELTKSIDLAAIFRLNDKLLRGAAWLRSSNLREQDVLEEFTTGWAQSAGRKAPHRS